MSDAPLGPPTARPPNEPSTCPHCGATAQRFLRNGTRQRRFLGVANSLVIESEGLLTRWKCPSCRRSFTGYPDHALPFKHFDRATILALCRAYLDNPDATYRGCVFQGGFPIAYPDPDPLGRAGDDDKTAALLSHTALYRWVRALAEGLAPPGATPFEEKSVHPRVGNRKGKNPA